MSLDSQMETVAGQFRYKLSEDEVGRWRRALGRIKITDVELDEFLDEATEYGTHVGKPWQLLEQLGAWVRIRRGKPALVPASICPEMHPPEGEWPENTAYRCPDCGTTHLIPILEAELVPEHAVW